MNRAPFSEALFGQEASADSRPRQEALSIIGCVVKTKSEKPKNGICRKVEAIYFTQNRVNFFGKKYI